MALMILVPLLVLATAVASLPIYPLPLVYVALSPIPENIYNQVQDTRSGEYAFGYSGGPVAREEARTADGVTRGAYSYVDAHGIVQYYRYVADADGFRVVGTNIPTDEASSQRSLQQEQLVEFQRDEKTAEKSAEESVEKSAEESAEESVEKSAEESIEKSAEESIEKSAEESIEKSAEESIEKSVEKSAAESIEKSAEESIEKSAEESIEKSAEESAEKSVEESAKKSAEESVEKSAEESVEKSAEESIEKSAEESADTSSRKKRHLAVENVYALPVAPLAFTGASVPTATSSQSRVQIHNNLKAEIHTPVETYPIEAVAVPLAAKTIETVPATIPLAIAASVPTATSSQSRFQIHKSLKTEISPAIALETVEEVPAIGAIPVETKSIETLPAAVSIESKTIETLPVATPLAVAASVPIATSSQSRFQIHNTLRSEIREPIDAIPVPIAPVEAPALPIGIKTIESPVIPLISAAVATATSSQRRFQVHNSAKLEFEAPAQQPVYKVVDLKPIIPLHHGNAFSLPSIARNPVGVGLGVVSSPLVAYDTYGTTLVAEA